MRRLDARACTRAAGLGGVVLAAPADVRVQLARDRGRRRRPLSFFASAAWIAHVVLGDSDAAGSAGGLPLGLAHAWLGLCAAGVVLAGWVRA